MFTTEKELSALLGEVEKEFSSYLAKAETTLAKSEEADSKKPKDKEEKPDAKESKPEAKEDAPAEKAPEAAPEAAAPTEEVLEAPAAEAQADAAPQAPAAPEEGHGYDEEDMAHMQAMYASMSRAELIAHHDAIKAVLDGMGMEKCGSQMPDQAAAPMAKSETDVVVEVKPEIVPSQETELLKSELVSKDAKITELNKTLEAVTAFVTKLVEKKAAPAGKAITSLETIAKSEVEKEDKQLTKKEIADKLLEKASDPKLAKSDREAINAYYTTGQINLTGISHLLK